MTMISKGSAVIWDKSKYGQIEIQLRDNSDKIMFLKIKVPLSDFGSLICRAMWIDCQYEIDTEHMAQLLESNAGDKTLA